MVALGELLTIGFFVSVIRLTTPILLASLGQIFTQRSGVINLGVEGMMLMGAIFSILVTFVTGSVWLGIMAGIAMGALMGVIMALLSVTLRVNQILAGLSIFFLGLGLSTFIYRPFAPISVIPLEKISIPLLSEIPVVGPILFQQNVLVYLALILVPLSGIILFRTSWGLKIRATGESPEAVDTLGINVYRIRYLCIIIGGMLAGLAGTAMTVGELGTFTEGMTVGRGWIAVAIVYFGKWIPYRVFIGSLVFGGTFALQLRLQALGFPIPYEFLLMLPYILTIIALTMMGRGAVGPASTGKPYERGEQ